MVQVDTRQVVRGQRSTSLWEYTRNVVTSHDDVTDVTGNTRVMLQLANTMMMQQVYQH